MGTSRAPEGVDALLARIERLETEGRALKEEVRDLREPRDRPEPPTRPDGDGPVTRRRLIGMAGAAAAAGVTGAVVAASPAGATHQAEDVGIDIPNAGAATTALSSTVAGGPAFSATNTTTGTALAGVGNTGAGVVATSTAGNSLEVSAPGTGSNGAHAQLAPAETSGPPIAGTHSVGQIWMDSLGTLFQCIAAGMPGTWVQIPQLGRDQTVVPTTSTRLATSGSQNGWWVANSGSGTAVVGQSNNGTGVSATTDGGVALRANVNASTTGVHLELLPTSNIGPPSLGTHELGRFVVDQNGTLFQCVVAGLDTAAKWVAQSTLVTLASPFRIYDSRVGQPNPSGSAQGVLAFGGGARPITCGLTPNPTGPNLPSTTSAILFNVTLANTVGGVGSVVVWAQGAPEPPTASITWTGSNVVVGNAVTSGCDTAQRVQIKCTTGVSTHVILDVIGFYV